MTTTTTGKTTQLAFRCPNDVVAALEAKAKAEGLERTTAIIKALRLWLGLEDGPKDSPQLVERLDQVEAKLAAVIAQLAELQAPALQTPAKPAQPSPQRPIEGQMSILAAIADQVEAQRPTASPAPVDDWLTREQAFEALGGNPTDEASEVARLDGKATIRFQTFRNPKTKHAAYGVEFSRERFDAGQPCMRLLQRGDRE